MVRVRARSDLSRSVPRPPPGRRTSVHQQHLRSRSSPPAPAPARRGTSRTSPSSDLFGPAEHHQPLTVLAHLVALVAHLDIEGDDPAVALAGRTGGGHRLMNVDRV